MKSYEVNQVSVDVFAELSEMREIQNEDKFVDFEEMHARADDLLCELLRAHGESKVADMFDQLEKWYA